MTINEIILNLGFLAILIGITVALLQWKQRTIIIGSLAIGLLLVMIGQISNGRNEAWLLLVLVLVGGRKLFAQDKTSKH